VKKGDTMEKTVRVCAVDNEAESEILCSILGEQGIPYTLRTMEDRAYDGLYVSHGPWAWIEAPSDRAESIARILKDIRATRVHDEAAERPRSKKRESR
jgi:hypothetical protein